MNSLVLAKVGARDALNLFVMEKRESAGRTRRILLRTNFRTYSSEEAAPRSPWCRGPCRWQRSQDPGLRQEFSTRVRGKREYPLKLNFQTTTYSGRMSY
jgi:hypothetical protein